jgi:hypothetical protein
LVDVSRCTWCLQGRLVRYIGCQTDITNDMEVGSLPLMLATLHWHQRMPAESARSLSLSLLSLLSLSLSLSLSLALSLSLFCARTRRRRLTCRANWCELLYGLVGRCLVWAIALVLTCAHVTCSHSTDDRRIRRSAGDNSCGRGCGGTDSRSSQKRGGTNAGAG